MSLQLSASLVRTQQPRRSTLGSAAQRDQHCSRSGAQPRIAAMQRRRQGAAAAAINGGGGGGENRQGARLAEELVETAEEKVEQLERSVW